MIDTDAARPETFDDPASDRTQEAPWRDLAEHARRELEAWSRSRPRDRHHSERLARIHPG